MEETCKLCNQKPVKFDIYNEYTFGKFCSKECIYVDSICNQLKDISLSLSYIYNKIDKKW